MRDLHKLAKERNLEELESAWMARLEQDDPGYEELFDVADYVTRRVDADTGGVLLWALVTAAADKMGPVAALPLARRAAELSPKDAALRQELGNVYAAAYPDVEAMPQLVTHAGLIEDAPIGRACDRLDIWAALKPGTYVLTRNSRRVACVEQFNVAEGLCVIREPRGPWSLDLDEVVGELERLDQDDLRALALFEPERLAQMAEQDPVGLVRLTLSQAKGGTLPFRELKQRLVPAAISPEGWSAWWQKAKAQLLRAPHVAMSGTTQPAFALREEALSYEDEMTRRFKGAGEADEAMAVALEFARERAGSGSPAPELEAMMRDALQRLARQGGAQGLAAAAVLDQLCQACDDAAGRAEAVGLVAGRENLAQALAGIEDERVARRAIALVRRAAPDAWADAFEAAMPVAPFRRCDQLARELAEAQGGRLARVGQKIAGAPDRYPEAFAWLWRAVCDERGEAPPGLDRFAVTLSLLALANRLGRATEGIPLAEAKRLRGVIRSALVANDFRAIRGVIAATAPQTAQHVRAMVTNHRGLPSDVLDVIHKELKAAHPDLFEEQVEPWEDEAVFWTTNEGLAKRRADLERLMHEDIPRNARAIGEAAARGDLSENAEWTAAVEERNLLATRAATMQEDLAKARVLQPDMVTPGRVTVGARVHVRNLTGGGEEAFVFLGPWDTDVEHRVYFYRAPLSLAFMGKSPGDHVVAGEGEHQREFEILSVECAV